MIMTQDLFVNVYETGGDEFYNKGEFYTGDTTFQSAKKAYDSRDELSTYRYTAKLVPVEIELPYTPKHGEKCNVETRFGNIFSCTAVVIEDRILAHQFYEGTDIFHSPEEIKRFIKL